MGEVISQTCMISCSLVLSVESRRLLDGLNDSGFASYDVIIRQRETIMRRHDQFDFTSMSGPSPPSRPSAPREVTGGG